MPRNALKTYLKIFSKNYQLLLDKLVIMYYNEDANKRKRGETKGNGSSAEVLKKNLMKGETNVLS